MNDTITPEMKTFFATYDWAKSWHDLPWAHDAPTLFLAEVCRRRPPGRALDLGCGGGTDSVFLARQGWQVTSLDFMPKALEYTLARAREAGVTVKPVQADITRWEPPHRYDLVLDHGLLHNLHAENHAAYRERVLAALADDGEYLLLHWHPRFPGQADGRMGPRRVSREDIGAFFAPELAERYFVREEFEDLPDMVGGSMTQAYYWFRRNPAHLDPKAMLGQIRETLARHGISDADSAARSAGSDPAFDCSLPEGLLARIIGPGRLGISLAPHEDIRDPDAVIAAWAPSAGTDARTLRALLTLFATESHAGICLAGAPRCGECSVTSCKRQRYR